MHKDLHPEGVFVTGTDTGVGKTWVSLALMSYWQAMGLRVAGMKPVASGCQRIDERLENEDAALLRAQSDFDLPYSTVNPYAYEPPIAPHLAAEQQGESIRLDVIGRCHAQIHELADVVVVEGVGGWLVPLNGQQTVADLAMLLGLPVVVVVGIRLGCLNHALLTVESVLAHGARLAGWIGSFPEPYPDVGERNVAALKDRISAPCLGILPWQDALRADRLATYLDLNMMADDS